MKSRIASVGMALAVLFAIGTSAGAPAQALEFHAEEEGVTSLTGQLPQGSPFGFHWNDGTPFCAKANFTGTLPDETSPTATLFLEMATSECITTLSMGSCHFVLHASGEFEIAGSSCAEKPIEYNLGCKVLMGPQKKSFGLSYENEGLGTTRDVKATFEVPGLHYTQSGFMCGGGTGTFTNGAVTGTVTLSADKKGGQQGLWVE